MKQQTQKYINISILIGLILFVVACQKNTQPYHHSTNGNYAVAVIHPLQNSKVKGTVHFEKVKEGVQIQVSLSGLTPGEHGFHVHQYGDCSRKDGKAAGGHYNPEGKKHAGSDHEERHVGDLGNITAYKQGKVEITWTDSVIQLKGKNSIIGRSIVIHADKDDLKSQPSGAAGRRIACGVIGIAKQPLKTNMAFQN